MVDDSVVSRNEIPKKPCLLRCQVSGSIADSNPPGVAITFKLSGCEETESRLWNFLRSNTDAPDHEPTLRRTL